MLKNNSFFGKKNQNKIAVLVRYTVALIFFLAWLFVLMSPWEKWSQSTILFVLVMFPITFYLLIEGYKDKPIRISKRELLFLFIIKLAVYGLKELILKS